MGSTIAFADLASGLLRDCARADLPFTVSEMGHALAICAGLFEAAESLALWRRFEDFRRQRPTDVIPASPFGAYHVHRALARMGLLDELVQHVVAKWGPMVDAGAATTWENLPNEDANGICTHGSHCHGWAGIPVVALVEMVLGLDPKQTGTARCERIGGVDWIEATLD